MFILGIFYTHEMKNHVASEGLDIMKTYDGKKPWHVIV